MKIGFDAKRAFLNNTGLGNYSRLVIDSLSKYKPENNYRLYTPRIKDNPRLSTILFRNNVQTCLPKTSFSRNFSSLWRVSNLIVNDLKSDKIDLFHGLSNELPISISNSGIPSIVTIHDLIFLRYPEYYHLIDRTIYNYKFLKACENSSKIIAVSECTKRDIVDFYGINEEKIEVVYQGCSEIFRSNINELQINQVKSEFSLPERYILYVGTIESRKNLLLAVKALNIIDPSVNLIVVGRKTKYTDTVIEYINLNNLQSRVRFLENLNFNVLPVLYKLALASVYPSRFEGFGIPILESITCGTPAIGCTGSCLEEAGGKGGLYVDPDDEIALAEAINSVIEEGALRTQLIEEGARHAEKFTYHAIADNLFTVYKKTLNL